MRRKSAGVCAEPGCHELTEAGQGYCAAHEREPWRDVEQRRPRTKSGWELQQRRKRVLRRWKGRCHVCAQTGADEVDHVICLAEGGPDTEANLRPIHAEPCHRRKTEAESARARVRTVGRVG